MSVKSYYNRGIDHLNLANYREAIKNFDQAIKLNPKFAPAYAHRGHAYLKLGDSHLNKSGRLNDYKRAIKDFNQAIICGLNEYKRKPPNQGVRFDPRLSPASIYLHRGIAHSKLGDHKGAVIDYTEAISRGFTDPNVYCNRGKCYSVLGNYHEAIVDFNQAITLDRNYAHAYYERGITWSRINKKTGEENYYEKAIKDFKRAKELAFKEKNINLHKLTVERLNKTIHYG